jgi:hypothetical protein
VQSCSQTISFGGAGAHRRNGNAAAAIKNSETVQMSSGAFDAQDQASPATGVNVRALRKRAHSRKIVWSCTLLQNDSEAKAPCLQLPA